MIIPPSARRYPPDASTPAPSSASAKLLKSAKDLEGVFTEQLFKAMRATVPEGEGALDGGAGEEMFTGLMDQRLAAETPKQWHHGIGDALYRQLSGALPHAGTTSTASPSSTPTESAASEAAPPAAPTEDPR
jgi:flagellar protein FlgJ